MARLRQFFHSFSRRGPHYCAANAASDHAEAFKLTLMGLAPANGNPRPPQGAALQRKGIISQAAVSPADRPRQVGGGASYQCTSKKTHLKKDNPKKHS